MKKVLWVCSDLPYPATHGGRVDMWQRILKFKESGFKIDLVITIKDDETINEKLRSVAEKIHIIKRDNSLKAHINIKPFQVQSRIGLKELDLNQSSYDLLFLESEYVCSILENKTFNYDCSAIRIHNNEAKYFYGLFNSEKKIIHKFYYLIDSFRFIFLRSFISKRVKNYFFISNEEVSKISLYKEHGLCIYHPTPYFDKLAYIPKKKFNVLFVGSLFMVNNQEAIIWYLENVHEKLYKIPGYKFIIVGNDKNVDSRFFDNIKKYSNIEVNRSPKTLDGFYENSMIFVNPMQNGAGVKLKTINAIEYGLPVVSTNIGAEGTGLIENEDFILANTSQLFYESILNLYKNENLRKILVVSAKKRLLSDDILVKQVYQILDMDK